MESLLDIRKYCRMGCFACRWTWDAVSP